MTAAAIRRELANLRQTVRGEAALPPGLPAADDSVPLARELAASFGELVKGYRRVWGLSQEEAVARAGATHPADEERILSAPPDQVQWRDLDVLARTAPELAQRRWEEVKQAARQELLSGHRAAEATGPAGVSCWQRARFLAVRDGLAEAWGPRNGLEWTLIDLMAQAHALLLSWQENLVALTRQAARSSKPDAEWPGHPLGRRLSEAEMTKEAAAMVERWHRLFVKALEALQRQRRLAPAVVIRNAGQVNVGGQQLNVNASRE
jgi:hypothetical protein